MLFLDPNGPGLSGGGLTIRGGKEYAPKQIQDMLRVVLLLG